MRFDMLDPQEAPDRDEQELLCTTAPHLGKQAWKERCSEKG